MREKNVKCQWFGLRESDSGRYQYNSGKSDGAVIGPFSGSSYRIFIDLRGFSTINSSDNLTLGNLESFTYWSKDGFSLDLEDNESNEDPVDNFTVGYNTTLDCSNWYCRLNIRISHRMHRKTVCGKNVKCQWSG